MAESQEVRLGQHLDFSNGSTSPVREPDEAYPVYGANGVIGYSAKQNAEGPLIIIGRVGSYCGSLHYSDADAWVTDNALVCRAKNPKETRYWYYALQTCRLNEHRAGSGQPLLNQKILREISVRAAPALDRQRVASFLGALDSKIAVNGHVIENAQALMLATAQSVSAYTPLSNLASRSTESLGPEKFDDVVAHFSLPAFDSGAGPDLVSAKAIKSTKFLLSQPCVLFSKLNPRIPRIWNVVILPPAMAVASTEFVILLPVGVEASVVWSAVQQPDVVANLQHKVAGTTGSHQRIQPHELLQVPVRDLRRLTARQAQKIASLGAMCQQRQAESACVSHFRDAMLPVLASGQLCVKDAAVELNSLLTDLDKRSIRRNETELYDDRGLPQ